MRTGPTAIPRGAALGRCRMAVPALASSHQLSDKSASTMSLGGRPNGGDAGLRSTATGPRCGSITLQAGTVAAEP
eukprot:9434180-Pyramimonas_sp.AAC.1